jgi:ligand-binding sensor domain-containing protein
MKWKWLYLLQFVYCTAAAQPYSYKLYSQKDGLSNNGITSIAKDDNGFLWIGTINGLNRFDGNTFDVFTNNPTDSTTIGSNEVQNVFISSNQTLWVSTAAGISKYNIITQAFTNYAPDTLVLPKIGHNFPTLNEDADKNIWVGTWYDLLIFNPSTQKFKTSGWAQYTAKVKPPNGNHTRVLILDIKKKSATEFWILTTYGLFSVHTSTLQFIFYPFAAVTDYYGSSINYIDEDANLWISSYNKGLLCFKSKSQQWQQYYTPPQFIKYTRWNIAYGIQPYSKDTLLYCANNSFIFFNKKTTTFSLAFNQPLPAAQQLPTTDYYNIYKTDKVYWLIGNQGIVKLKLQKPVFTFIQLKNVSALEKIYPVNEMLLAGDLDKSIFLFNKENYNKNYINLKDLNASKEIGSFKKVNTSTGILSTDNKLYYLNLLNFSTAEIPLPPKIYTENNYTVRNVVIDNNNNLWIRLRKQGIATYNTISKKTAFAKFITPEQNKEYSALYYDSLTDILITAVQNEGIYLHYIAKNITQHILLNISPSQKGGAINCIVGDKNGNVFLSDVNAGFYQLNLYTKQINRYTTSLGLIANNCNWLCFDSYGYLWIATQFGISRFDRATNRFLNFSQQDGLPSWANFLSADEKGNIYQPWQNGYYVWNSSSFINTLQPGNIYLRHCWVNNKLFTIDTLYKLSSIQNNIALQFGCLQFENTESIQFEYKLNNSDWLPITEQNKLSFSNLSPNIYTLHIRLKNKQSQLLKLAFVIKPPYYLTWWFILFTLLTILFIAYAFVKFRIKNIRRQSALKQKITETEMMALRAQMNPHFIFNSISSIDNFILDNDKENASSYLNKFAKLIRNILDNSKNDVVPFWKDWETIQLYLQLEQLRSNNSFSYTLRADDELLNGHYKIPPLIIQPYIENAIHHGLNPLTDRVGNLQITGSFKDNILHFIIADNGIGRKQGAANSFNQTKHQSYGMQLTKERIALFNEKEVDNNVVIQDNIDEKGNATGTTVHVYLKV